ncbi:MAG: hypothetical protein WC693_03300 [Patescibacteria group bacterium]|jgi:hypothetical protein
MEESAVKRTTKNGLWTVEFGQLGATLKALQDHGVTPEHLARIRSDQDYAKSVAAYMRRDDLKGFLHQKQVRDIFGDNFFGIEEWSEFYGVNFSQKQLRAVSDFPWDEDFLKGPCPIHKGKELRETHFAFLGLHRVNGRRLTISRWRQLGPKNVEGEYSEPGQLTFGRNEYWNQHLACEGYIHRACEFRWYLMPLGAIGGDLYHLDSDLDLYEWPSAVEEVTKLILYHRKNGIYLNKEGYGRCREQTGDWFVQVGFTRNGEINISKVNCLKYIAVHVGNAISLKLPVVRS